MGNLLSTQDRSREIQFAVTLAQIAALGIVSDMGYYLLMPQLGQHTSYSETPIAITLYYVFWIGIAVITFWPIYRTQPRYGSWDTFENRLASYIVWSIAFVGSVLFASYVLPILPSINWKESWTPEFVVATPWYFLPKSIEILFQQLLIVALVLALSAQNCSLLKISLCCAILFGGMHILLVFGGVPIQYAIRFMISAAAFGLLFPYLILRVRNGIGHSYIVHWLYYAVSVVLPHVFLSSVK